MIFDERIVTKAGPRAAFGFLAYFGNLASWNPAAIRVEQVVAGPVGLGTKFRATLAFPAFETTFDYHVETWEPPRRAVLIGTSPAATTTDSVFVTPWRSGSRVRWKAEIHLVFPLQVVDPLFAWLLRARVHAAVANMRTKLDALPP